METIEIIIFRLNCDSIIREDVLGSLYPWLDLLLHKRYCPHRYLLLLLRDVKAGFAGMHALLRIAVMILS